MPFKARASRPRLYLVYTTVQHRAARPSVTRLEWYEAYRNLRTLRREGGDYTSLQHLEGCCEEHMSYEWSTWLGSQAYFTMEYGRWMEFPSRGYTLDHRLDRYKDSKKYSWGPSRRTLLRGGSRINASLQDWLDQMVRLGVER